MNASDLPFKVIKGIITMVGADIATVPWLLIYNIAHWVLVIADFVAVWLIVRYIGRALSYRVTIDLRALPPDVAEILKRAGVRERYARRWSDVRVGASMNPPNSYRDAIVSADALIDSLLQEANFTGRDAAERFGRLNRLGMRRSVINGLFEAHRMRNRIAHESTFAPSPHVAEQALQKYERFLTEVKVVA
jgi:hypothetical protein